MAARHRCKIAQVLTRLESSPLRPRPAMQVSNQIKMRNHALCIS